MFKFSARVENKLSETVWISHSPAKTGNLPSPGRGFCVRAYHGRYIDRVGSSAGKIVVVYIKDKICAGGKVRGPVIFFLEAALKHYRNLGIGGLDFGDDTLNVLQYPGSAATRETAGVPNVEKSALLTGSLMGSMAYH